jgi:ABC-2 type transport system ATP-binding protein
VRTYWGGIRRRLDLAASLIGGPSVLFPDEPAAGLDPSARAMTWEVVRELAAEGTTVLLTTQYLEEANRLARRVAVINGGGGHRRDCPARARRRAAHGDAGGGSDLRAAIAVIKPYTRGRMRPDQDGRRLSVPVTAAEGLTMRVMYALDAAGIRVNDVIIQRASLDDVFLSLTGRAGPDPRGVSAIASAHRRKALS